MMPQAHAMPMVEAAHAMAADEHCTQPMETRMSHDAEHATCTHCDQPDSLLQNAAAPVQPDLDLLPDLPAAPTVSAWISQSISLFSRTPTGPPRSSSLLYYISPRIRV